jgi:hypothetical protein
MYQGAAAMLQWVPPDWGTRDEDGEFEATQLAVASMFAFFGGLTLVQFIDRAAHSVFFLRDLRSECKELKRILDASSSSGGLSALERDYVAEIAALNAKLDERAARTMERHLLPEGRTIQQYQELIALVQKQRAKVEGSPK